MLQRANTRKLTRTRAAAGPQLKISSTGLKKLKNYSYNTQEKLFFVAKKFKNA
jgi:hypothetical protein